MISVEVRKVDLAAQRHLAAREVADVADGNGSSGHRGTGSAVNGMRVGS